MILDGTRAPSAPLPRGGLLLIGDPHLGSRQPGRRLEADWPEPILRKLGACVEAANAGDLQPVFLGDLFDTPAEPDERLKARLVRLLKAFRHRPLANVGNHDIRHTTLSDGDTLAVLALADVIDVAAAAGPVAEFAIGETRIGLGASPYGQPIPPSVAGLFPEAEAVVWLTHHDVAFGGAYPGALPPHPIEGCALVVNGHMHGAKAPVRAGGTLWTNPGNIARQSADLAAHVPRAFALGPDLVLRPVELPHARDVFDLAGRLVAPAREGGGAQRLESGFVSLLKTEADGGPRRTDDAAYLREAMETRFAAENTPAPLRALLASLLDEAVARRG